MTDNPKEKNEREYYRAGKANWDAFRFSMDGFKVEHRVKSSDLVWLSSVHDKNYNRLIWYFLF